MKNKFKENKIYVEWLKVNGTDVKVEFLMLAQGEVFFYSQKDEYNPSIIEELAKLLDINPKLIRYDADDVIDNFEEQNK